MTLTKFVGNVVPVHATVYWYLTSLDSYFVSLFELRNGLKSRLDLWLKESPGSNRLEVVNIIRPTAVEDVAKPASRNSCRIGGDIRPILAMLSSGLGISTQHLAAGSTDIL